jgi:hypothetical protein
MLWSEPENLGMSLFIWLDSKDSCSKGKRLKRHPGFPKVLRQVDTPLKRNNFVPWMPMDHLGFPETTRFG